MVQYSLSVYVIIALSIFMDIVTGISQAVYNHTLDSKILRNGMFHKLSYVFAIMLALFVEYAANYLDLGIDFKIFVPLAAYIVLTEIISILENITRMNEDLLNSPIFKLLSQTKNRRDTDK